MKKERKIIHVKRLTVAASVMLFLFLVGFLLFCLLGNLTGDPEIADFGKTFMMHVSGMGSLFLFKYHDNANVIYFGLSILLYGLLLATLVCIVIGIIVSAQRKNKVIFTGIVMLLLMDVLYLFFAAGIDKYWAVANGYGVFDTHKELLVPVLILFITHLAFALLAILIYVVSLAAAYDEKNAPVAMEGENYSLEEIRRIVREELERLGYPKEQPQEEQPQEEVQEEQPQEEQFEEEPQEEQPQEEEELAEEEQFEEEPEEEVKEEEQPQEGEQNYQTGEFSIFDTFDKDRKKKSFEKRLRASNYDLRHKYYDLRDYIRWYGVSNRISIPGHTFSYKRQRLVFINIVGKHIRVYFRLDPNDYAETTMPIEAATAKKYEDITCMLKVRSDLSYRRAKKLVDDVMTRVGIAKPEGEQPKETQHVFEQQ